MYPLIFFLAAAIAIAPAAAQDAQAPGNTVGPPQLRDFDLAPDREPAQPQPQTQQPQPEPAQPPATKAPTPSAPPATQSQPQPKATPAPPAAAPTIEPDTPAVTPETLTPDLAPQPEAAPPAPLVNALDPQVTEPAPAPAPVPLEKPGAALDPMWMIGAAALAALLLGAFLFRRWRRGSSEEVQASELAAEAPPAPPPAPKPAPAPVARPWLEVEFRPQRASAADEGASVQFELLVRNRGDAPARNVRVEGRMFNAGADHADAIQKFYSAASPGENVPKGPTLAPGGSTVLRGAVSMPRDKLREVEIAGRRLFIPMVGFNVHYEWGEGQLGRTSTSYLVGRESGAQSQKMGGFRLDLGPRIYRSLTQRPTPLASMT